ncbi:accessory gene regulator ArgB-like protein [Paenibacillus sp. P32E]|uniref:accessory gene regulator ArgB-like protein n=1 Tax=Paenibacillus sp. P32E TaxID=1349434 RepID=UPI00093E7744|nr:accessory gene regulator B family protein [Paenibacillus sp. P32E]OKP91362.1 accessory regulator AgrB [Paenibacillus sp. P32E]
MINVLALKIASKIKEAAPTHPASIAVLSFSLALLINAFAIVSLTVIIALFTNKVGAAITALLSFAVLRQLSGGIHLKSGMGCIALTTGIMTFISFTNPNQTSIFLLNITSVALVLIFAPSRIERQSRIPEKYYPHLKIVSALLVSMNFLISSPIVSVSFFIQSITLIKPRR